MITNEIEEILSEYEQKRRLAELKLNIRKENLYKEIPRLYEIENEINKISIQKTKNILTNNLEENLIEELEKKMISLKEEKEEILNKKRIEKNFFKPNYECELCNDTGYLNFKDRKTQMCNCLKQKIVDKLYNISNLGNVRKENFENFKTSIFSNKVDLEKYKMNISPRDNIEKIKKASIHFVEKFEDINTKNLFFTGNTGLGKTYMTNCIANEILKKGKIVLYQTAPVLLETIIDCKFNKYKNSKMNDFYNQVLEADLLIIDDLGTEVPNSMKISELFTILNARALNLNNKLTRTIISTNLSIEKIFDIYEERIGSRIAGFYDIYYFFGEDLRLKK